MIVMANTFIFFILTGIQYWVTDYLIDEIGAPRNKVYVTFAIVSITGPVFGVIIGGNVTSRVGGFRAKKALRMTQCMAVLCVASAIPIPFIDDFPIFVVLLWFLLFFGGYMMPTLSGIMLETIDSNFKATGNSVANLSYNLLGFLPAPSVYGFVSDLASPKYAMATLMFTPIISLITINIASIAITSKDILGYKQANKPKE